MGIIGSNLDERKKIPNKNNFITSSIQINPNEREQIKYINRKRNNNQKQKKKKLRKK